MEWIKLAKSWYTKHKEHVDKLVIGQTKSFMPTEGDISHPELWKPASWKWFLEAEKER